MSFMHPRPKLLFVLCDVRGERYTYYYTRMHSVQLHIGRQISPATQYVPLDNTLNFQHEIHLLIRVLIRVIHHIRTQNLLVVRKNLSYSCFFRYFFINFYLIFRFTSSYLCVYVLHRHFKLIVPRDFMTYT